MKEEWVGLDNGKYINMALVREIRPDPNGTGSILVYSAQPGDTARIANASPADIVGMTQGKRFNPKPKKQAAMPNAAAFSLEELEQAKEQISNAKNGH